MGLKDKRYRAPKVLEYAKGQFCTVNLPGVCRYNKESTVSAHCNFNGGAMGAKTHDHSVAYACYWCHGVLDGAIPYDWADKHEPFYYMGRGVINTQLLILRNNPKALLSAKNLDEVAVVTSMADDLEEIFDDLKKKTYATRHLYFKAVAEALFKKGRY